MSTDKPPPLRGYREIQETKRDTPDVDPKKFREELTKVSESGESQEGKKRRLPKGQEEPEEELLGKQTPIAASGDLFSLFMNDTENSSPMTPQTPQNVKSTQAPSTSSHFTIEEDTAAPQAPMQQSSTPQAPMQQPSAPGIPSGGIAAPTPSLGQEPAAQETPLPTESPFIVTPEMPVVQGAPEAASTTPPEASATQGPSSGPSTKSPERVTKKVSKDTSLLAKKAPSVAQMQKQKKELSTAPIKLAKTSQPTTPTAEKPSTAPAKQPPQAKPLAPATQTPITVSSLPKESTSQPPSTPLRPPAHGIQEKPTERKPSQGKVLAQELTQQATSTHADSSSRDRSKEKDKDKEKATESVSTQQVVSITPFTPTPPPAAPAYATLPSHVYELFEQMVGLMTIEQGNGVTTTTVTVNLKDSVFHGAEIILDHYSTAPNAFNVTIAGSPQAQALINGSWADLVAAFEQSKLAFQVNLRRPILLEEYHSVKRKEKTGKEKDKKNKK